jgi:uncharacterized membrane protein YfcA
VLHTPLGFACAIFAISVVGGLFGSLVGLGGGVVVVPLLTWLLGVDIHYAIGASVVSIIATSSGAAASYVRDEITNLRIGIFLEVATTLGALCGALLSARLAAEWLFGLFGGILAVSALGTLLPRGEASADRAPDPSSLRLKLQGTFHDPNTGQDVTYVARRWPVGFGIMYVAGFLSGLLGIGAGVVKVLAMDLAMGLPIKVSTATSNFMIGVTAVASAGTYYLRGQIEPVIVAPVALGVLAGSTFGSKIMPKMKSQNLRRVFLAVALLISAQMILRAFGVRLG